MRSGFSSNILQKVELFIPKFACKTQRLEVFGASSR
jgi:hypothetical protein